MKEVLILEHINDIEKAVANLNPNDLAVSGHGGKILMQ
jgi:hypothetical protein